MVGGQGSEGSLSSASWSSTSSVVVLAMRVTVGTLSLLQGQGSACTLCFKACLVFLLHLTHSLPIPPASSRSLRPGAHREVAAVDLTLAELFHPLSPPHPPLDRTVLRLMVKICSQGCRL